MVSRGKISSAASICLHAKQDDVFKFLVDPRNTKRWVESVEYLMHRPQDPIRVGTEALCRVSFLGTKVQARYRIMELDEPNRVFGEATSGKLNYRGGFDLAASSQEGFTDVTWSVAIEYPAILSFNASYFTDVLTAELIRTLKNLHKIFV